MKDKLLKNNLARKATKQIADHYVKIFAQISIQEGIVTVSDLTHLVLSMSVDDFCDYVFLDSLDVPSSDVLSEGGDSDD